MTLSLGEQVGPVPGQGIGDMNRIVAIIFYALLALAVASAIVYFEAPHYLLLRG
jgi:hypothetical protein